VWNFIAQDFILRLSVYILYLYSSGGSETLFFSHLSLCLRRGTLRKQIKKCHTTFPADGITICTQCGEPAPNRQPCARAPASPELSAGQKLTINEIGVRLKLTTDDKKATSVVLDAEQVVVDTGFSDTLCLTAVVAQSLGLKASTDKRDCKSMELADGRRSIQYAYLPGLRVELLHNGASRRGHNQDDVLAVSLMYAYTTDGTCCLLGLPGLELLHVDVKTSPPKRLILTNTWKANRRAGLGNNNNNNNNNNNRNNNNNNRKRQRDEDDDDDDNV